MVYHSLSAIFLKCYALGVGDVIKFSLFNNVNPIKRNTANVEASSSQYNKGILNNQTNSKFSFITLHYF